MFSFNIKNRLIRKIYAGSLLGLVLFCLSSGIAQTTSRLAISEKKGDFALVSNGKSVPLIVSTGDFPGVIRAVRDLQADIRMVTSSESAVLHAIPSGTRTAIIIGTLGQSELVESLVRNGKIPARSLFGKWESYLITVVSKPISGIDKALVIAGSDKRGTIYGIYELSAAIGVSPWYWWADAVPDHRSALYVTCKDLVFGPPSVKYRGIFLNDEAPDLTNWVAAKFGMAGPRSTPPVPPGVANYNHEFYARVFELILRLRGNYLWPAMWNNAFNEDDTLNAALADEYGIVMGTSHQEPMLRAQKEWDRRYGATLGHWNYALHPQVLEGFWREGIQRNRNYESIVTLGLRGADDTEMAPGGPAANRAMLEHIVDVQRQILKTETGRDPTSIPQLWCLYKEVQEYYAAGMRVPEDVTLLWAEDNWGNVRRLPTADERARSGDAGVYYHFDYHGGPRSYQWINTNPIAKIYDQLSLARQYGADRIWIVNTGHLKGYEFPLEFFMNLAWYADSLQHNNLGAYTTTWAARLFGSRHAAEIAGLISEYTRINGRCKPELLAPGTYSLVHYGEAEKLLGVCNRMAARADSLYAGMPALKKDAFAELVWFPVKATALVNALYVSAEQNRLYAAQGRALTNEAASRTRSLFTADTALMGWYNRDLAGGRWNHFMDQTHIGYTTWRDPPENSLAAIPLTEIPVPETADMGVSPEGSENAWPGAGGEAILPECDIFNRQTRYVEVFNKGTSPFTCTLHTAEPWIQVQEGGTVSTEVRFPVKINFDRLPPGRSEGSILVRGTGKEVRVRVQAFKPSEPLPQGFRGFVEGNGVVSAEAAHFSRNRTQGKFRWLEIEGYGHTLSGMRATGPRDERPVDATEAPCLEYDIYLFSTGSVAVRPIFGPALNFLPGHAVRYGVSLDDEPVQWITLVPEDYIAGNGNADWEATVSRNSRTGMSYHTVSRPGAHTLKIWMADPGVVLQKVVADLGGLRPSYLGPPESYRINP